MRVIFYMQKVQFILGVGCQNGGTTWIDDQLSKVEQVDLGFQKEYHVFDTLYIEKENCDSFKYL